MRLLYKASIDCAHFIEDSPDLITKKCAEEHGHTYNFEFSYDAASIKAHYKKNDFLDFALVKELTQGILDKYDHKNITKLFEIHTVEDFAIKVKSEILKEMEAGQSALTVRCFETAKYGVEV